jgi:predicted transcriptional regulator
MVKSISESTNKDLLTYKFESFIDLKFFLEKVHHLHQIVENDLQELIENLPKSVAQFLLQNDILKAVEEINTNSSNLRSFIKRFYHWFDAFRVLKYLNFAHETYYSKQDILDEANKLYGTITGKDFRLKDHKEILEKYRKLERKF